MVEQMTSEQATYAALRDGVERAREALCQAAWTRSWMDAEPRIRVSREALARELAWHYTAVATDESTEILRTGADEALHLVLRAVDTAIVFEAQQRDPSVEVRRLVAEAITTLDEALASARAS